MLRRLPVLAACVLTLAGFLVGGGGATRDASAAVALCGIPGSDGPVATLTGVVNTYYPPTASAAAGATSISLGASVGAVQPIAAGDLLLVIQMQDAAIDSTNTAAYGGPTAGTTALNSSGLYEYVLATNSVPTTGGVLNLSGTGAAAGLNNSYSEAAATAGQGQRRFQVIRVPQYSAVTLTSGLTGSAWNGTTGGVLAIDVAGATNLNAATVSVSQIGFRAGLGRQLGGPGAGGTGTDYRNLSTLPFHGSKAEGIAGTPNFMYDSRAATAVTTGIEGYPNGSTARGAPGNAGGGGTDPNPTTNDQNTGGGGGGNGGSGGVGGNSWNTNQPVGGGGGVAFAPSAGSAGRVILGGGGGAGSRNNTPGTLASSGGNGGGIVLLRTGTVSGTGTITADGGVGVTPDNDGGGGGGAGGSVVVLAQSGGLGGLTVQARGGRGTDAWPTNAGGAPAFHGPGGGGAGGAVFTSSAPTAVDVTGGANGTTTTLLANFGATPGSPGVAAATATASQVVGVSAGSGCLPVLAVTKSTSTPAIVNSPTGTTATYIINVVNAAGRGSSLAATISDPLPAGFTYASTVTVATAGGATRTSVADPLVGSGTPAWGVFTIPGGGSVRITFVAAVAASVPPATYQNPALATITDPVRTTPTGTAQFQYDPASSVAEDVTVAAPRPVADLGVTKTVDFPTPLVGSSVTFTIGIHNYGPAAASGVSVSDPLPAGLAYQSSVPGQGSYNPGSGVWSVGNLANGASTTLVVKALVSQVGRVTNTASVQPGAWLDPNAANDAASAAVDPQTLPGPPDTGSGPVGPAGTRIPLGEALLAAWLVGLVAIVWAIGLLIGVRPASGSSAPRPQVLVAALGVLLMAAPLLPMSGSQLEQNSAVSGLRAGVSDSQLFGKTISEARPAPLRAVSSHAAGGPVLPDRLRIPRLSIDVSIEPVGTGRGGAMDVPGNLWTAGWLKSGPQPGAPGQAVLDGHKNSAHGPGLFNNLGQLQPGDRIYVGDRAGAELTFEVMRSESYSLSAFSRTEVFGSSASPALNLITCVGSYSAQTHTYDHRLVVFTRLLGGGPSA